MPNVYLEVLGRQSKIRRIALKSSITVGRQKGCKLRIPSRAISRQHCRIELTNGHISVTDLGSSNGTWVNGERLQAHTATVVEDASKLAIGNERFRVIVQSTENLDATVVDQNLFPAAAANLDLGATILDPPPEATVATEPEIDFVETSDALLPEAADDVIPVESDVTPFDDDVAVVAEDSIDESVETASEFNIAELDDFDLLADEEEPVAEVAAELVQDDETLVTEESSSDESVEPALEVFEAEPDVEAEEMVAVIDTEDEVVEVQEVQAEVAEADDEQQPEADEDVVEIAADPAEPVQGSLFEFEDTQPAAIAVDEALDVVDDAEEEAEVVADSDDGFGFGVDENSDVAVADTDEEVLSEADDTTAIAPVDEISDVDSDLAAESESEVSSSDDADVDMVDEFVAVVEDDETESLEFLVDDAPVDEAAVVNDLPETMDVGSVPAGDTVETDGDRSVANVAAEAEELAFLSADDDQIDADHLSETVAEAVAVDESASVLSDTVVSDSVLDLDEDELPIAEYVGDDEVPVAALVEDADDDIPDAIEIEEVDEIAAAIIETDEDAEVVVAERAEEDDDAEFELVAEEDDEFDLVDETESAGGDPLASTMMMTQEMQASGPQSIDTGFSVGETIATEDDVDVAEAIVEPGEDEVPAEHKLDEEEAGHEVITTVDADVEVKDDVTAIVETEFELPDDDSDVVPVATTEPPKKKGGLFGWLNIFKRKKKTEPEPQIIDDLDDESGDADVIEAVDEDTAIDGSGEELETQLITDEEAFATVDDEDDTTIVEDLDALDDESADELESISETAPVAEMDIVDEIDDEDEELTAVDRSQFADDHAAVAAGSDEDDAMDFLSGADDGEDLAASFLGENEPAPAKTDDSDFEDFFADIKD